MTMTIDQAAIDQAAAITQANDDAAAEAMNPDVPASVDTTVGCVRSEALFASDLIVGNSYTVEEIREAVTQTLARRRARGCREIMAFQFGEYLELALSRMAWARQMIQLAYSAAQ